MTTMTPSEALLQVAKDAASRGNSEEAARWTECADISAGRSTERSTRIIASINGSSSADVSVVVMTVCVMAWMAVDAITDLLAEYGTAIAKWIL